MMSYVFWHCINTHLNTPLQQTAQTSDFVDDEATSAGYLTLNLTTYVVFHTMLLRLSLVCFK